MLLTGCIQQLIITKERISLIEYLKAIGLGIVQGLTEFLPISSSGHLSVFQFIMNKGGESGESSNLLSVLLHMGTLLAVFIVYYKTIWEMILEAFKAIKDIFTGKFSFKNMNDTRKMLVMMIVSCVPLLLLLVPIGNDNMLMDFLGGLSEDKDIIVEGCCFLFTAVLLLTGTRISKKMQKPKSIDTKRAFGVGFAQFLAAGFPGISRSGSTISTGMMLGIDKEYMVRYSFILGIPAILAANVMEIKDAVETNADVNIGAAIVGILTAAVVGFLAIKILEWLVKKDKFKFFGYYCLVLGPIVIILGIIKLFA